MYSWSKEEGHGISRQAPVVMLVVDNRFTLAIEQQSRL